MKEQLKDIFSIGKYYFVGSVFQKIIPFIFLPIYTKYLTPADYGIYSLLVVVNTWAEKLINSPVGNGVTRYYHNPEIAGKRGEMVFSGWAYAVFTSTIIAAIFYFFSDTLSQLILGTSEYGKAIQLFALNLILNPLGVLMYSLLRVKGNAKPFVAISILSSIISSVCQLIFLVYYDLGFVALIYGLIITAFINLIGLIGYTIKDLKFSFEISLLKRILYFGYPLVIAALVAVLSKSIDRFLLNKQFGLEEVGLFSFGVKIASIILIILTNPLKQTLLPIIYKLENNVEQQHTFVKRFTPLVFFAVLFVCIGISVYSKEGVELLASDPSFYTAWIVVPILAFSSSNEATQIFFGYGMAMANKSSLISFTSILVLIITIISLVILISPLGMVGVAISYWIGSTFRNLIRAHYSRKYYGQEHNWRKIVIIFIVAAFITALGVSLNYTDLNYLVTIFLKALIILLYPLIIWNSGIIDKNEKEQGIIWLRSILEKIRILPSKLKT